MFGAEQGGLNSGLVLLSTGLNIIVM